MKFLVKKKERKGRKNKDRKEISKKIWKKNKKNRKVISKGKNNLRERNGRQRRNKERHINR